MDSNKKSRYGLALLESGRRSKVQEKRGKDISKPVRRAAYPTRRSAIDCVPERSLLGGGGGGGSKKLTGEKSCVVLEKALFILS